MLSIRNLSFRYPAATTAALDDVSLDAARGEVLGLLGPNGAGKTTLLAHLCGLLAIQRGTITLDQIPLSAQLSSKPMRIALAPQEYAFYPSLSVSENLDCFAGAGGLSGNVKKIRMLECLAFAQLERYSATRANRLSGGLKRRLNLAIAMLHRPELLLFDEPTVGVDPQSRAFLLQAIKKLAQQGCAVIYTSHYMEEVEAIADRVVILDRGRVLQQGALDELLNTGSTQLLLAVEGNDNNRLAAVLSQFGSIVPQRIGIQVTLASRNDLLQVLAAVQDAGLNISHMRFGNNNLEQLFMSLTHQSLRD